MLDRLNLPVSLPASAGAVHVRRARPGDLHGIMQLLSDDPISSGRGDVAAIQDEPAYAEALEHILADAGNDLLVVTDSLDRVIGTLQLTLIPGMSRRGGTRLLVEAVRIASNERSSGIGTAVMRWVVERAAIDLGAALVQLTSDAARTDAHRFYRRLGFIDSHVGFKFPVVAQDLAR